jgi:hypothetical protein
VQSLGELVDRLAEVLAVDVVDLQQPQERDVACVVLVLAVLRLVSVDGLRAVQRGVHLLFFRLRVRDEHPGQHGAQPRAVLGLVAQLAEQLLEQPVVVEDQFDESPRAGRGITSGIEALLVEAGELLVGELEAGGRDGVEDRGHP